MRVCGVEIKSNEAIIVLLELQSSDQEPSIVDYPTRRISLDDDENQQRVKDFLRTFSGMIRDQRIEKIAIKKRAQRGQYASGAVSFKIEGLIQLVDNCEVVLISATAVSNYAKKHQHPLPTPLRKFQEDAYNTGRTLLGTT